MILTHTLGQVYQAFTDEFMFNTKYFFKKRTFLGGIFKALLFPRAHCMSSTAFVENAVFQNPKNERDIQIPRGKQDV